MTEMPETRFTRAGEVDIAYQVVGDAAPLDLVFVPGWVSHLEVMWELPEFAHFLDRLAGMGRLILFDKRGTGLSDRMAGIANLEERMDDVRAVMDAASSERAALFGISEGGPMSLLFAATYPERASALALYGSFARHPTVSADNIAENLQLIDRSWGTGEYYLRFLAPSRASDGAFRRYVARYERQGASPSAVMAILRMNSEIDVRQILPTIRIPTLLLHRVGDPRITIDAGRYLAAHIPRAKLVELPGTDHFPLREGDIMDRIVDEIEEFLTGTRGEAELDRVLATVLFTDIVGSTGRLVELGDRAWRQVLDLHDERARQEIARFRGRAVKSLGDGFLATFDGPARAVRCAAAIAEKIRSLGIEVRSGLHTGEIELRGEDIGGVAVHIAERIAEIAGGGEVLVSSTVRDLVAGSGLSFADLGSHQLKGLPEALRLFRAGA